MACLTMDSYKIYFDIDADDIVRRMRGVFYTFYKPEHFRNNIMGSTKTNELKGPDLYGPFWITMTLIFFIGVSSYLVSWIGLGLSLCFPIPVAFRFRSVVGHEIE